MCGFAGIVARDPIDPAHLMAMSRAIHHRGPDGVGYLLADHAEQCISHSLERCSDEVPRANLAVAHRRLSIIDTSHASDQPLVDAPTGVALAFNGEIYNYREIRSELAAAGHHFATDGDTEVLLRAYLEWGERCVERFVGMWAFVIFDPRTRQLILSRDRFGIKPLFYAWRGRDLWFASEIKALLAPGTLRVEPCDDTIAVYLRTGIVDHGEDSFFAGIKHFRAAHTASVSIDDSGPDLDLRCYWSLPTAQSSDNLSGAADTVRELLESSLELHGRSDVPVGTCLSGGLDSSGLICMSHKLRQQGRMPSLTHDAFGYVPPDVTISERPYMEAVAAVSAAEMTYVAPTTKEFIAAVPEAVAAQDEPFGSASIAAQWFVFRAAADKGMKVMLDGQGADEVFGGYHHLLPPVATDLMRSKRRRELLIFELQFRRRFGRGVVDWPQAISRLGHPWLGLAASRALRLRSQAAATSAPLHLSPDASTRELQLPANTMTPASLADALRLQTFGVSLPALLRFEDRNSMAHSIEARVPFLDHRLVEYAFSLPDDFKIHKAIPKYVLKEALRPVIPRCVYERRDKIGFRPDADATAKIASDSADDLVTHRSPLEDQWFSSAGVRDLIQMAPGRADLEAPLWRVMNLKWWLRSHWP